MPAPIKGIAPRDTRITLTVPRETYDGIKSLSQIADTSINDFVSTLLENTIKKNAELLQKYNIAKSKFRDYMKNPALELFPDEKDSDSTI